MPPTRSSLSLARVRIRWRAPEARLSGVERTLRAGGAVVRHGGDFDRWDLEVRGGLFGSARMIMGVEEHGQGMQMVRARLWPRAAGTALVTLATLAALAGLAFMSRATGAGVALAITALFLAQRMVWDCGVATRALDEAVRAELAQDR